MHLRCRPRWPWPACRTRRCYSLDAIGRTIWRMASAGAACSNGGRRPTCVVARTRPAAWPSLRRQPARLWAVAPLLAIGATVALAACARAALAGRRAVAAAVVLRRRSLVWWVDRPLQRAAQRAERAPDAASCAASRAAPGPSSRPTSATADNHLPPDNVQEHPVARVAHRTSPTNIGFALLANLAARDFGYITLRQLLARIDATARHDGAAGAPSRPLLQLVRHPVAAAAARRATSPPSTAATSPAQLMTLRGGLLALADAPLSGLLGSTASPTLLGLAAREPRRRAARCAARWSCSSSWSSGRAARDAACHAADAAGRGSTSLRARPRASAARRRGGAGRRAAPAARPTPNRRGAALGARARGAVRGRPRRARGFGGLALPLRRRPRRRRCRACASWRRCRRGRWRRSARRGARAPRTPRGRAPATLARAWTSGFLYDDTRHLLSIGYNVDERRARCRLLRPARLRGAARQSSSPSRRASCRRTAGSRSAAC